LQIPSRLVADETARNVGPRALVDAGRACANRKIGRAPPCRIQVGDLDFAPGREAVVARRLHRSGSTRVLRRSGVKKLLMLGTAIAAGVLIKRLLESPRLPAPVTGREQRLQLLGSGEPVFGVLRIGGADEALAILARFDEHQIQCAELALERDLDDATLGMAERMRKEHGDHLDESRARVEERGAETSQFGSVAQFDGRCRVRRDELRDVPDEEFVAVYLERVAQEHAAMVQLIDGALLPEVEDATVRELLTRHRAHLSAHLAEARMLH
jgi:predicted outer membrane protein